MFSHNSLKKHEQLILNTVIAIVDSMAFLIRDLYDGQIENLTDDDFKEIYEETFAFILGFMGGKNIYTPEIIGSLIACFAGCNYGISDAKFKEIEETVFFYFSIIKHNGMEKLISYPLICYNLKHPKAFIKEIPLEEMNLLNAAMDIKIIDKFFLETLPKRLNVEF